MNTIGYLLKMKTVMSTDLLSGLMLVIYLEQMQSGIHCQQARGVQRS